MAAPDTPAETFKRALGHAARALAGHKSHQIALICDNPNPWYVYEIQFGVRERCARDKIRMIAQPYDRASPTLFDDIVALLDQANPDGLVLAPPACDDTRVLDEPMITRHFMSTVAGSRNFLMMVQKRVKEVGALQSFSFY